MSNGPDDSYWLSQGDDPGGGNGGGHRRRRADKPSKFDKAVKKGVQKVPGGGGGDCLLLTIRILSIFTYITAYILMKIAQRKNT